MASQQLVNDLKAAGHDAHIDTSSGMEFVVFAYDIPVGGHIGSEVKVGLQAHDWPMNPPGGPHINPRIQHPGDQAHHVSPLGADWIYWSRPFPDWATSQRTVEEYLTHLRTLFFQFTAPDETDETAA